MIPRKKLTKHIYKSRSKFENCKAATYTEQIKNVLQFY